MLDFLKFVDIIGYNLELVCSAAENSPTSAIFLHEIAKVAENLGFLDG